MYVLPGRDYTTEDLEAIAQQAAETAAIPNLMEDAWEVTKKIVSSCCNWQLLIKLLC